TSGASFFLSVQEMKKYPCFQKFWTMFGRKDYFFSYLIDRNGILLRRWKIGIYVKIPDKSI
ncbi:MAG: hypothetical protein U0L49_10720, partial [Eubacterium sp.]|nr:hypothetical protein [Eubacterium sp.]